jgi:ATP-binding cassette subfamily F protein 3
MSENLLQVQKISKSFGARYLFNDASFSVNADEHVGVIGPNGAGKSTLFRILNHEESVDKGEVVTSNRLSLGYLSQHDHWIKGETGNQYLDRTSKIPLWELKPKGKILEVDENILEREILSLSGGYRMRIKLLGLLGQKPNLMLLDEPTNYLDLETTLVLERFLQDFDGAFLLISHDREFLRRTTDHILEIESGEMTKYNGNIDDYFEQKELIRSQLEAQAMGQAEKRKKVLDFVARFGASATKARQAQSKLKSLAKMEVVEIKPLPQSASIRIPAPVKTGKMTLSIENASFGYPGKTVLSNVSLQINRGDHVAVVGLNGAGKSTLLKGISGVLSPISGNFEFGFGVETALFSQHVVEALSEFENDTVFKALSKIAPKDITTQEILNLAGSLLFSGDDTKKTISVLSGGEKSRVALGRVLLQRAPCLVLDEPTNHLDFQTVEALASALKAYEGTVIVVSHDRGFIKEIGTKILEVAHGTVRLYPGTYEEYIWKLQQEEITEENIVHEPEEVVVPKNKIDREEKKKREKDLRACEKKIEKCEEELHRRQAEVERLNLAIAESKSPQMDLITSLSENGQKIQELEALWLELVEEKERLK